MTVPQRILQQLGGGRFITMTGSKHFIGGETYLTMKLVRNKLGATHLKINLEPMDWYKLTFLKCDPRAEKEIDTVLEVDMVYFDKLQEIFAACTGLYTHL